MKKRIHFKQPTVIKELPERGSANAKHFLMSDGTVRAVIADEPINFFDENKKAWKTADNSLTESENAFSAKFGKYRAEILKPSAGKGVRLSGDGKSIAWYFLGPNPAAVKKARNAANGPEPAPRRKKKTVFHVDPHRPGFTGEETVGHAVYENAAKDVDLEYTLRGNAVKENILIKERAEAYEYLFRLETVGLFCRAAEDGKTIEICSSGKDENGKEKTAVEFVMPAPFMTDAAGAVSDDVYFRLKTGKDGKSSFIVAADPKWINAEDRVFPVAVDPTVMPVINNPLSQFTKEDYLTTNGERYLSSVSYPSAFSLNAYSLSSCGGALDSRIISELGRESSVTGSGLQIGSITHAELVLTADNPIASGDFIDARAVVNGIWVSFSRSADQKTFTLDVSELYPHINGSCTVYVALSSIRSSATYTFSSALHLVYSVNKFTGRKKSKKLDLVNGGEVIRRFDDLHDLVTIPDPIRTGLSVDFGIEHVLDPVSENDEENLGFGKGVRLNLHETLTPNQDNPSSGFTFTDRLGISHATGKKYFYRNEYGRKISVDAGQVHISSDGQMTADVSLLGNTVTREVFVEDVLDNGWTAYTQQNDGVKISFYDPRSEDVRNAENQKENIEKYLNHLVVVKRDDGSILSRDPDLSDGDGFESFVASAEEKENGEPIRLLLSDEQVGGYRSFLQQEKERVAARTEYPALKNVYEKQFALLLDSLAEAASQEHLDDLETYIDQLQATKEKAVGRVEQYAQELQTSILPNTIESLEAKIAILQEYIADYTKKIGDVQTEVNRIQSRNTLISSIASFLESGDLSQETHFTQSDAARFRSANVSERFAALAEWFYYHKFGYQERNATFDIDEDPAIINLVQLYQSIRQLTRQMENIPQSKDANTERLYLSASAETIENARLQYHNLLVLNDSLEKLYLKTPIHFLTNETLTEGFNKYGDLVVLIGTDRHYVTVDRDPEGQIESLTDETGRKLTFEYFARNCLSKIQNADGESVSFDYSGVFFEDMKLAAIRSSSGRVLTVGREESNGEKIFRLEDSETKIASQLTYRDVSEDENQIFKLCSCKNLSKVTAIAENEISEGENDIILSSCEIETLPAVLKTSDPNARFLPGTYLSFTDEKGNASLYFFNQYGVFAGELECTGGKVSAARRIVETEHYVKHTTYAKENTLNRSSLTDFVFTPGSEEYIYFNEYDQPTERIFTDLFPKIADKAYSRTVYTYDGTRRCVETVETVKDSENGSVTYTAIEKSVYTDTGKLTRKESYIEGEEATEGVSVEEYEYDEKGNVTKSYSYNSLDPSSKFCTEATYDERGRMISETDATGENKTEYEYFRDTGKVRSMRRPNGSRVSTLENEDGTEIAVTASTGEGEENSNTSLLTCGMVTTVKSGNNVVGYEYDEKRRVKKIHLNGEDDYVTYSYTEGENEDVAAATLKDGTTSVTKTDRFGNKTESSFAGVTLKYTYNADNKPTAIKQNGITKAAYTYNTDGTTASAQKLGVSEGYVYNADKKPTRRTISGSGSNLTYSFAYKDNTAKDLESIQVGGYTVLPKNDANGRATGKEVYVGDNKIAEEQVTYLKFGDRATAIPSTVRFGNRENGRFVLKGCVKYKYDEMGNICEIRENGKLVARYEYDKLSRLTREDNKLFNKTVTFTYDANGNILSKQTFGFTLRETEKLAELNGEEIFYSYDGDKLLAFGDEVCAYDGIGNPTTYRGKTALWQNGRQMVGFDGHIFAYDIFGRRTGKDNITYIYDTSDNLIREIHPANGDLPAYTLDFIYDHSGLFAIKYNDATYLFTKNLQKDVINLLDNSGNVMVKYDYDAWGNCKVRNPDGTENTDPTFIGNINPFRYRSYYFDVETNLFFLKTRYYDPETGRFVTIDNPVFLKPNDINGLNLYAYCKDNPVMYSDENGEMALWASILLTALLTPLGAIALQLATSVLSYAGMAVASIFDEDIRQDMNDIGWNPFNSNEAKVKDSQKVSFYKGAPVFRTIFPRSGTFCAIFLAENESEDAVKHEYGHIIQHLLMGPVKYLTAIGIPSIGKWLKGKTTKSGITMNYYDQPWEITANLFGGATKHQSQPDLFDFGYEYLFASMLFGPLAYLLLLKYL